MYKIVYSKRFKKSVKKINKSGDKKDISKLKKLILTLSANEILNSKYKDHNLSGDMSIYRECHVNADLLLIYEKNENEKVISLINIGNHSDLFE